MSKSEDEVKTKQGKFEVLPQPIKSQSDRKQYKTIRLENGLTALLISDQPNYEEISNGTVSSQPENGGEEKLAACAVSVGVGSYSNPDDIQGLAHFVEHMVFMGSEKYPKENGFDALVTEEGGSDNASTDVEVTTYYFDISEEQLPQGMDMFSQFFISPLMSKDAMQREREAIESEFAIAKPSDAYRMNQLLLSTFPEGHPARTFTWGNLKSLRDDIADDDKLYQAAHEFRKRHYSAHRITVAVQSQMDFPTLEQYVVNTFGNIPSNKLPPEDFSRYSSNGTAPSPDFNKIYYVKPVSDTTMIQLTWYMRSLLSEYESKPQQYIAYLLGHEGKGSLSSYLKKKVWALSVAAYNSDDGFNSNSMYSLFTTEVVLTKQGLDHIDEVLEAIFSYVEMLRRVGPSEQFYQEIKTIEDTSFRYVQESKPADNVEKLSANMQFYPPEHYITGDKLYYKYDPKGISSLLDSMTAESANIMILSNKHSTPIQYDSKEAWFGTEYKKIDIPDKWMQKWLKPEPNPEFQLPDKNIYVTTDFDLIAPDQPYLSEAKRVGIDLSTTSAEDMYNKVEAAGSRNITLEKDDLMVTVNNFRLDQPNLLRKDRRMELWYKPDFKFRLPTALLYFYLIPSLSILMSPREACLLDLWTDVLQQGLKEAVYPASLAHLEHTLSVEEKGITLKVNGYSQNLHLLVDIITKEMRTNTDNLTEPLFEAVREERARTYHNLLIDPEELAKDIRFNILVKPNVSPRDKAMLVRSITLDELKEFNERLFTKLYMQTLIQGNIQWDEAIQIAENVYSNIGWDSFQPGEYPELQVRQLPLGVNKIRVMNFNPQSTNSIITNYYQAEAYSPDANAVLEMLNMLMQGPIFDVLRTQEQLGYSVYNVMRYTYRVLGMSILVNTQVDKFSVAYVDARIKAFLEEFFRDLAKTITEETLADTKESLIQVKHASDNELKDEVERNWREILNGVYQFQRLFEEAKVIAKVTVPQMYEWVEKHFTTGNGTLFRKLAVQVMGHKIDNTTSNESTATGNATLSSDYHLTYLDATQQFDDIVENEAEFIKDLPTFAQNLPIIEVPKVELPQC